MSSPKPLALLAVALSAALTACGGSSTSSTSTSRSAPAPAASTPSASTSTSTGASGAPAQQAPSDARSAATGDIPDNQIFLTFRDAGLGVALRYPEGWTERRGARQVSFVKNANGITLTLARGAAPTPAQVRAQLTAERARLPGLSVGSITPLQLPGGPAVKASYSVRSQPDPVTGKRVVLLVDRYVYSRGGRIAVLDLATPKGVDNKDAYRMISRSFKWL